MKKLILFAVLLLCVLSVQLVMATESCFDNDKVIDCDLNLNQMFEVKSTDYSSPWIQMTDCVGWLPRYGHTSVAMADGSIVLMGGVEYYTNKKIKSDVWRSTDNGATWTQMTARAEWSPRSEHTSVVMPDGSIVLMGGGYRNDVWRSTDNGATWTQMTASAEWSPRIRHTSVVTLDGSIILMGGEHSDYILNDIWRSTDNGATWTQLTTSAEWLPRAGPASVAILDGSIILMGGWGESDRSWYRNDVWRSTDSGATWTQMTASAGWKPRYGHTSVALPDGSIVLMGGHDGSTKNDVWRSTDNGATWTQMTASAEWSRREAHTSIVRPDGSIILMGGYGNSIKNDVWRSTDYGATWNQITDSAGWKPRYGHTSVALPDGSIVLMGGHDGSTKNDVWRSTDNGATWTLITTSAEWSPRRMHTSVVMPDGSIILMGGKYLNFINNDVWRSTDNGATWTQLTTSAEWSAGSSHTSVVLPDGSILLIENRGGNYVWRSTDGGVNWDKQPGFIDAVELDDLNSVVMPDGSIVIIGRAIDEWISHVYRSMDNGVTWTIQSSDPGWLRVQTSSVALPDGSILILGGEDVIQGFKNDVWRSTDNGATWTQLTTSAEWSPRTWHTSVVLPDGSVTLMGGYGSKLVYNDVWRLIPGQITPVAAFTASPTSGSIPLTVQFTDQSTGSTTSWNWEYSTDGFWTQFSTAPNLVYTFTTSGTYSIRLTATNDDGTDTETKLDYINVYSLVPPVANFTATPTSGKIPLTVNFTDQSAENPASWLWNFGDNSTSEKQHPTHTYTSAGIYTVSLTVTNENGSDTGIKEDYIIVEPLVLLVANFTATPTFGKVPLTVNFMDQSAENPSSWLWSFGDNSTSDSQNPSHTYTSAGIYTVSLTVTNDDGSNTGTKLDYITVMPPAPVINFTGYPTFGFVPLQVHFNVTNTGGEVDTWLWSFGEGTTSTDQNLSYSYTNPGAYTVGLTATNAGGNDTEIKTEYISVHLRADLNRNGRIDIGDVAKVAWMAVGLIDEDLEADFDGKGDVGSEDAARIAYYYVGKIPTL